MKRLIPLLLTVVLLLGCMTGNALAENKFTFDKTVNTVFENEELQLVLIREGTYAEEGELTFKTSNKKVATVDENGVVQGLAKGQATITATLKIGKSTWSRQLVLTVARRVESIEVTGTNLKTYEPWDPIVADIIDPDAADAELPVLLLRKGKAVTVTATCKPTTATNRKWKLVTSDDTVVRASGTTLTGRQAGECIVTVESVQNPEVSVSYRALVVEPVTQVKVTGDAKTMYIGEMLMLTADVAPDTATIKDVVWTSDKPDNATVDEYGVVTGVSKGSAIITAKAADGSGRYGTFTVTVRQQPEEITLNKTDVNLKKGNYVTLSATVKPSAVNDKTVTWSTSDDSVAKVSTAGRVTAVSPGVAIITCESKTHPEIYAQAIIHVYQPVTKITFNEKNPYVAVGESIRLTWEVGPETATDTSVTLSTNKENVLRVEQDGTVTGLKRGEAYVYATANDGSGKKATVKVQVTQPVEGVSIRYDEVSVGVNEKVTNTAIFTPEDASIKDMSWTVEDATIATVSGSSNKATVTGRAWGETTVIGVTEDGSYVTTFDVSVGNLDKPIAITNLYVENGNTIRIVTYNESNLTITGFDFEIEVYDAWGNPIPCNSRNGSNSFEGRLNRTLMPGESAGKGQYTFGKEFTRPEGIGKIVMTILSYETDDGNSRYIRQENREERTWQVTVLEDNDG